MPDESPTRGGKRKGAGRPFVAEQGVRTPTVHITLPPQDKALLNAIGKGNISAAVRLVLAFWRHGHDGEDRGEDS